MKSTKSEWRRELLALRSAVPSEVRKDHARAIVERACKLACFEGAASILGYEPIGAEVDPSGLMEWTAAKGASVFVPTLAEDGRARWSPWRPLDDVVGTPLSIESLNHPVVVVLPGVGYDETGVRLGRGQGFYDRVLATLRSRHPTSVVALAFECQVVARLPVDPWDAAVDVIVTERRILECGVSATAAERGRAS